MVAILSNKTKETKPIVVNHVTVIALWKFFTYAALVWRNFGADLFAKKYDNRISILRLRSIIIG